MLASDTYRQCELMVKGRNLKSHHLGVNSHCFITTDLSKFCVETRETGASEV